MTRSAARERIQNLKGTPGAAQSSTPGAGDSDWLPSMAAVLTSLRA
jgi:hypothetical protein